MNTDKVEGKLDQVKGKIKQDIGEAVGNDRLANSGVADQVKGAAKETWGNAKDTARTVNDDARNRTAETADTDDRADSTAHNVRENITSAARNVRDAVNEKLDDIKHKRAS